LQVQELINDPANTPEVKAKAEQLKAEIVEKLSKLTRLARTCVSAE